MATSTAASGSGGSSVCGDGKRTGTEDCDGSDPSCCSGKVGGVNGLGGDEPTIGDVSVMIDAKFMTGRCEGIIVCLAEADINQSGGCNITCDDITIGDISSLIEYLFNYIIYCWPPHEPDSLLDCPVCP